MAPLANAVDPGAVAKLVFASQVEITRENLPKRRTVTRFKVASDT